ncbi:MAG: hypothetical protein KGS10_05625 [Chloroflexi bacterium]|nr:hypothetical protein [Chloroflexota bacterium]
MQDKVNESILGVIGVGYEGRKTHSEVYAGLKRAGVMLDHIDLARRVDALVAAGDLWQLEFEDDQVFSFCRPTPPITDEDDRRYSDVVERQRIAEFLATVVVGEDWVKAHDIAEYMVGLADRIRAGEHLSAGS